MARQAASRALRRIQSARSHLMRDPVKVPKHASLRASLPVRQQAEQRIKDGPHRNRDGRVQCLSHSLHACLPACLPAFTPACLPSRLPACLPACLPARLPACLPDSQPQVEQRIKDGPRRDLDAYLGAVDKLKDAIAYFNKHPSYKAAEGASLLSHTLMRDAMTMLEADVRQLLANNRCAHSVPPLRANNCRTIALHTAWFGAILSSHSVPLLPPSLSPLSSRCHSPSLSWSPYLVLQPAVCIPRPQTQVRCTATIVRPARYPLCHCSP